MILIKAGCKLWDQRIFDRILLIPPGDEVEILLEYYDIATDTDVIFL